ncbi:PA0069 family radical SAM protein [Roseivirga sp. BDSF3-8]|uniref:PA0069 family radical SAM protein n=1 Tax=Roseivirga sp. BDSF3-8 TaxID=3241598 RepID=UPI0035319B51
METGDYVKGRGAQFNPANPFSRHAYVTEHEECLDEPLQQAPKREVFLENAKKVVNKVTSPDLSMMYSINPYQGCEHGCIYCYARNSHQYWGFSAGLDFESKLVAKKNAPELLEKFLQNPRWKPSPVSLSGNTDCYQPLEREMRLTRGCLEVLLKHRHPVGMITKNALILRDLDLLKELAAQNLVHVYISITTLDEAIRQKMEPRTARAGKRLEVLRKLTEAGVPCGVMAAPIIPGLNNAEIPAILEEAAKAGALTAGYTIVRLNGSVGPIFKDWLEKNFPDRAQKVWNQICAMHGGNVNDSQWRRRMHGEGHFAELTASMFRHAKARYMKERHMPDYNTGAFIRPGKADGQLSLF